MKKKSNNVLNQVKEVVVKTTSFTPFQAEIFIKKVMIKTNFFNKSESIRKHTYLRLRLFVDFCKIKSKLPLSGFKPNPNITDKEVLEGIYNIFLTSNYCRFLI